jgi:hypothetical protein
MVGTTVGQGDVVVVLLARSTAVEAWIISDNQPIIN